MVSCFLPLILFNDIGESESESSLLSTLSMIYSKWDDDSWESASKITSSGTPLIFNYGEQILESEEPNELDLEISKSPLFSKQPAING